MFGFGKKNEYDKDVLIVVDYDDGVSLFRTKGKRAKMEDGTYYYEIVDPRDKNNILKCQDIPTSHMTKNEVLIVTTFDWEQLVPSKISYINEDEIKLELLTGEQKEWFVRSMKRDFERMMDRSWWSQNKTLVLFLISMGALVLIYFFFFQSMGAQIAKNTAAMNNLGEIIKRIPVVPTPKPPA